MPPPARASSADFCGRRRFSQKLVKTQKIVFATHHCVREEEDGVQSSQEQSGLLFILEQMIFPPCLRRSWRERRGFKCHGVRFQTDNLHCFLREQMKGKFC